jgi:hypothetical protein
MIAYILVSLGIGFYLRGIGAGWVGATVVGLLAAGGMVFVLFRNVYPVPPAPYATLPWIFLVVLVIAVVWYVAVSTRPHTVIDLTVREEKAPALTD